MGKQPCTIGMRRVKRGAKVLRRPEVEFVSMVDKAANQTPFSVLKSESGKPTKTTMKKKTRIAKGANSDTGLHKLVFDKEHFETEEAVAKHLTENGYDGGTIVEGRSSFVVKGADEDAFDSINELPDESAPGVTLFVGVVKSGLLEGDDDKSEEEESEEETEDGEGDEEEVEKGEESDDDESEEEEEEDDESEEDEGEEDEDEGEEEEVEKTDETLGRTGNKTHLGDKKIKATGTQPTPDAPGGVGTDKSLGRMKGKNPDGVKAKGKAIRKVPGANPKAIPKGKGVKAPAKPNTKGKAHMPLVPGTYAQKEEGEEFTSDPAMEEVVRKFDYYEAKRKGKVSIKGVLNAGSEMSVPGVSDVVSAYQLALSNIFSDGEGDVPARVQTLTNELGGVVTRLAGVFMNAMKSAGEDEDEVESVKKSFLPVEASPEPAPEKEEAEEEEDESVKKSAASPSADEDASSLKDQVMEILKSEGVLGLASEFEIHKKSVSEALEVADAANDRVKKRLFTLENIRQTKKSLGGGTRSHEVVQKSETAKRDEEKDAKLDDILARNAFGLGA